MNLKEHAKKLAEKTVKRRTRWTGLLLIVVSVVILGVISIIQAYYAQEGIRNEAKTKAESQLDAIKSGILNVVNQAESAVRNNVWLAQWCLQVPDSLANIPKLIVNNNPIIAGSTIAIVPNYYKDRPLYSPYTAITNGEIIETSLATPEYDYPSQEWFIKPIELEKGYWSEPYVDTGGGEILMTTYSVPVKDNQGRTAAVLTADIDLEWLKALVNETKIYPGAFSTVVSRTGRLMVSPDDSLIMTTTIDEYATKVEDTASFNALNRAMLNKESGNIQVTHNGTKNMVYYTPIDKTGWAMNIIIPEKEMFAGLKKLNGLIRLLQILGLLLLILIFRAIAKSQLKFKYISEKKEKMENELRIASDIQMSMIPKTFPPFPEREDIDLSAALVPAKEVSGDLYDFFIRDEKLFFCIGDVAGKGVPASLLMAVTRSLFRSVSAHHDNPKEIVTTMNNSMSDMNESNMFVTFICCVLDLKTGKMQYCNAGHNAPLIFTDKIGELPVDPNLPLGVIRNKEFTLQEIDLHYDDAVFLYTDGITEAENPTHGMFGLQRLKETLSGKKPAQIHLDNVKKAVAKFVKDAPQSDDLTMLFFHYLNDPAQSKTVQSITLSNDIGQIHDLEKFIGTIAEEKGIAESLKSSINLAMEEAVSNVIMYSGSKTIDISAQTTEDEITFTITDSGKPFDPTTIPDVDVDQNAGDRPVGGLGIHLYRKIMDSVTYKRQNDKNILVLTKRIGKQ
ncbi:MAG: SpoIIE family protein phosphatase [Bacteroidales bacterium]|nr:SpoIIE family protein phosphatase [Bacteroidales bacterium]